MHREQTKLERIRSLLTYEGHSQRYQSIPSFVTARIGQVGSVYSSDQLAWDEPRFAWIDSNLPRDIGSAVELGSNLGYFSLRLSFERGLTVNGFEPVPAYAEVSNLFASLVGIENRAHFHEQSVGLAEIQNLPSADTLIFLNVLHHAGNIFDVAKMTARGSWWQYASEYLLRLSEKYHSLIFQTGNSVKGLAHFPSELAVPMTVDLLRNSGWIVNAIGMLKDFSKITYRSYSPDELNSIPCIRCQRNARTGSVEYYNGDRLVAELPFGTLQRPLFYCSRN